jgi:hypothetical protein
MIAMLMAWHDEPCSVDHPQRRMIQSFLWTFILPGRLLDARFRRHPGRWTN